MGEGFFSENCSIHIPSRQDKTIRHCECRITIRIRGLDWKWKIAASGQNLWHARIGRCGVSAYLDLLEQVLLYSFWPEPLIRENNNIVDTLVTDDERENGKASWPARAFTMIGRKRLRNIRELCERVSQESIPGAFAECGVWRGGASIYARAVLPTHRPVYVCDSFNGMPVDPNEMWWQQIQCIKVPRATVQANFQKFGLDSNVHYIEGFFSESLRGADWPIAVLRLDADMYRSTMDALAALYPLVSAGGFVIVDDYNVVPECKKAVHDYFADKLPTMNAVDHSGVWFRK